jgi:putative DNA primase/helicase
MHVVSRSGRRKQAVSAAPSDPFTFFDEEEARAIAAIPDDVDPAYDPWDNVVWLPIKKRGNGAAARALEPDRRTEITVFRSTDEPLGKTMRLNEHGKLVKAPNANMWQGFATRTPVDGANELAQVIRQIGKFEAITLGRLRADLPDKVDVTTKRKLNGSTGVIARDRVHLPLHEEGRVAIALLDYDTHDKPAEIVVKDFWKTLLKVCPALRNAERVSRASTSSGLYRTDTGEDIPGSSGMHVYIWAEDGSDIQRFLTALFERAWLHGLGWIMIAENGKMLERSIIDQTVWKPEGFSFEAPPTLKPPLAQRAERREPVVVEGEVIDTRTACLSLNAEERARFDELVAAAKEEIEPEAARVKAVYDEERIAELTSGGMTREAARAQVDAMWRGTLNSDTVLLFKNPALKGCTVKDVLDKPERFDGEYLADPAEPSLGQRDKAQVIRRLRDGWPWIKVYSHGVPDTSYSLAYTDEAKAEMNPFELPRIEEAEAITAKIMEGIEKAEAKPAAETSEQPQLNVPLKTKLMIEMVCAAEVKMKRKDWLWEGHQLRGALQLMTGQPGLGKSQVQIHFMACATAGLPWPDGSPAIEPVNVIMVTAEDAIDSDVVPRLKAAGADLARIHIIKCIKTDKQKRQFLLAEDLEKLEQAIVQIGNVGLVCLDPITAYMGGKTDAHKTTEVRSQLGPLKDLSERTNVAVSAITHPAKNAGTRAMDHFIASQAFIAAARVGHACFEELEQDEGGGEPTPTGRMLFTHVKHSGSRKMPTLAYRIEVANVMPDDDPFMQIETTRVVWDKEAVNISADQAVASALNSKKAKAKEEEPASEVVDFLRSMLDAGKGWCKQTEVAAQAKALGFSDKELRTARKKLAVTSKKDGFDGPWLWGWEGERPIRF